MLVTNGEGVRQSLRLAIAFMADAHDPFQRNPIARPGVA